MIRLRLTDAQVSALECRGITDEDEPAISRAWRGSAVLAFEAAEAEALARELTEAANAEDAQAEERRTDPETAKYARAACRSLTAMATKVRKRGSTGS